jgi:hypothetical protein
VFPTTKKSKQPQTYLHSDAHGPKKVITWALNDPSSRGAMHSKLLQPSVEEGHLAEFSESIKVRRLIGSVNAATKLNFSILEPLACLMRLVEEAKKIRLNIELHRASGLPLKS